VDGLLVLLLVVVAAAAGAVAVGLWLRKRKPPTAQAPVDPYADNDHHAIHGDPRKLKAGDLVELRGESYLVRGTLRLDEGGWSWSEHMLEQTNGERVWLSVEEDPDLELIAWTESDVDLAPGAKTLAHGGKQYRSDESGKAKFRSEATTGLNAEGVVKYHDYTAGDSLLSFEAYGEADWEASIGAKLSIYDVRIYPASAE
jgi:hypothetical protein